MRTIKRCLTFMMLGLSVLAGTAYAEWQALPDTAPAPKDNPTTPEKVELGKMLYFDKRLSQNGTVSCQSCHNVMEGGDDSRPTSVGVGAQLGPRNAPTVFNSAFHASQFWDGRAASLEEQAKGPITNPVEMGMPDLSLAMERVRQLDGYVPYFNAAFGTDEITIDRIAQAIAAYERTLITPDTPYDRFVKGDSEALTARQQRGMETFAAVGCQACHSGANFSGQMDPGAPRQLQRFPVFASSRFVKEYGLMEDKGRFESTGKEADKHMWKVPTLRNIALTAPYFHNGKVNTLEEAVRVMGSAQLNRDLSDQQVADIAAFLRSLTGEGLKQTMPHLPPTPGGMLQ
jgi:cytochrome c peroxidase